MMTEIAIILLFSLALFGAYQWGYLNAVSSEIEREILIALNNRELYALDLLDFINTGRRREIGFGILYPALNRLQQKSSSASYFEHSEPPRRKFYRLINPSLASQTADKS